MDDSLSRLSRLSSILNFLQSGKLITSSFLSKKFDVSVRTIYRDIRALEASGVPIYVEEGKGYRLMDGYTLPPITFSDEEANALITGMQIIQQNKDSSLVHNYTNAIAKIKSVLKSEKKEKSALLEKRVFYVNNLKNVKTSNSLMQIQKALTERNVLKLKYKALYKDEVTDRDIEPMAIYHTRDNWIVISWCRKRKDFREFRLDRILNLTLTSTHFDERDFDLLQYFRRSIDNNS